LFHIRFPPLVDLGDCGSGRDEEPSGTGVLRLIQIRLATLSLQKISLVRQDNLLQGRVPSRSSRKIAWCALPRAQR
jgi:hypothetical protein